LILLSSSYFPNIQYLSKFFWNDKLIIEGNENFQKQSFRNRCEILSANGKMSLFVPVVKGKDQKTKIKDVRIDYFTDWQKQHLKSIESAYNSSPFYEYIIDDILFVFKTKEPFLFDLNLKILDVIKSYLDIDRIPIISNEYIEQSDFDYRNSIHPKSKMQKKDNDFFATKYYQTFNDKFDFIPNLSILDLLFNEGPRSRDIILESIKKA